MTTEDQRPRIRIGWKVYEQVDPIEDRWRLVEDQKQTSTEKDYTP